MSYQQARLSFKKEGSLMILKTVAFIAGKKNPAVQKKCIRFSIEIKL